MRASRKNEPTSTEGIAERNFERKFQLAENIHVKGANPVNGLLFIELERVIPEEKKTASYRNQLIKRVAAAAHLKLLAVKGAYANPQGFAGTTVHKIKLCRTRFSEGDLVCVTMIFPPLLRQWIGFDKLANALQSATEQQTFPPYNIEKSDDNHYRITLALAGFRRGRSRHPA